MGVQQGDARDETPRRGQSPGRLAPEPYEGLQEELGEDPLDDLTPEAFQPQLEYMVDVLAGHPSTESAIFDRCPLDFLAYLRAIDQLDLADSDSSLSEAVLQAVEAGLKELDLIVFVRPDGDRCRPSTSLRARPRDE